MQLVFGLYSLGSQPHHLDLLRLQSSLRENIVLLQAHQTRLDVVVNTAASPRSCSRCASNASQRAKSTSRSAIEHDSTCSEYDSPCHESDSKCPRTRIECYRTRLAVPWNTIGVLSNTIGVLSKTSRSGRSSSRSTRRLARWQNERACARAGPLSFTHTLTQYFVTSSSSCHYAAFSAGGVAAASDTGAG